MPQKLYSSKIRSNHHEYEFIKELACELGIKAIATTISSTLNRLRKLNKDPDVQNYKKVKGVTLIGLIETAVKDHIQSTKRFIR